MVAYGVALVAATRDAAVDDGGLDPLVPVVLATMHAAHGVGFIEGSARWGVPWRALERIVRGTGAGAPYAGPIDAPSLAEAQAGAPGAAIDAEGVGSGSPSRGGR
jgi:hypothetical protein